MRRREEQTGNGKSKMTVMMFQLEGADETLREGIRTLSQALSNVLHPNRLLISKPSSGSVSVDAEEMPEAAAPESSAAVESENGSAEESQRSLRPTSKPRTPKVINLDLKTGKIPLKEFCESKKVGENDSRRYLVIAFWLKENLNIPAVNMDHMYTCYRFLGWQTPADASSPLRSMKQNGWFDKGTEKGSYSINHVGENEVIGMGGLL